MGYLLVFARRNVLSLRPDGRLAERLGTGLQNQVQRFKSATDL